MSHFHLTCHVINSFDLCVTILWCIYLYSIVHYAGICDFYLFISLVAFAFDSGVGVYSVASLGE
jgi:hypothetical protein